MPLLLFWTVCNMICLVLTRTVHRGKNAFQRLVLLICVFTSYEDSPMWKALYTTVLPTWNSTPQFFAAYMLNDLLVVQYDGQNQSFSVMQPWRSSLGDSYISYQTVILKETQEKHRRKLMILMKLMSRNSGIHTLQEVYGCTLNADGLFNKYSFDGQDFLSFDTDQKRWIASSQLAESTKEKWISDNNLNMNLENGLLDACVAWLKNYIKWGQASLEQKVPSEVSLTERRSYNIIVIICRVNGFYPGEIDVQFIKNEKNLMETYSTGVLPNNDGTYQLKKWIEIDLYDKNSYSCHIKHSGMIQKLDAKLERRYGTSTDHIIWILLLLMILLDILVGVVTSKVIQKEDKSKPFTAFIAKISVVTMILVSIVSGGMIIWRIKQAEGQPEGLVDCIVWMVVILLHFVFVIIIVANHCNIKQAGRSPRSFV